MTKVNIPNQRYAYKKLAKRLDGYTKKILLIYDTLAKEASKIAISTLYDGDGEFSFAAFPRTSKRIDTLLDYYVNNMQAIVYSSISDEWKNSNTLQDLLAKRVIKSFVRKVGDAKQKAYFEHNNEAKKAFMERKVKGLNLSERIWNQREDVKEALEKTLSISIEKGMSAVTLSKKVSKYLNDYPLLAKDYRKKFGKAITIQNCEYRSVRLARNEINMAYRSAEQERWARMDYIKGKEIKTTNNLNHKPDMCDHLAGVYPKDFSWTGWHVNCMCYAIPVIMSEEEYWGLSAKNDITDVPYNYKEYISDNQGVLDRHNATPNFIKDNPQYDYRKNKIFSFSQVDSDYLKQANFNSIDVEKYNRSVMNKFNITLFDKNIERLFDDNEIFVNKKKLFIMPNGNTQLVYEGKSSSNEDFYMKRSFRTDDEGKIFVYHDSLLVPKGLQGKGFSKRLIAASFEQYKKAGIDFVSLKANLDVGGYAWARYGFMADVGDVLSILKSHDGLLPFKEKAKELFEKWKATHRGEKYFPMNIIARESYGKELLLGSHWNGYFDLTDKDMLKHLEAYIGTTL